MCSIEEERVAVKYRKGFETDPLFFAIWDRIKAKTTYKVNYDTAELIKDAASAVKRMPPVKAPSIRSTKTTMLLNDSGVQAE